jgi:hypothetical protein
MRAFGAGKSSPLLWGAPLERIDERVSSSVQTMYASARSADYGPTERQRLELPPELTWPDLAPESRTLFAVHLAQFAPLLIAKSPARKVWPLISKLLGLIDAQSDDPQHGPWVQQLGRVELPLTLAFVLSDCEALRPLIPMALERMEDSIDQWLDVDGFIPAAWWPAHRAILGGWSRSMRLLTLLGRDDLSSESRERIRHLAHNAERATIDGNRAILVPSDVSIGAARLYRLAGKAVGERSQKHGWTKRKRATPLAISSEASGLTLMQSSWKRSAIKLGVDHAGSNCRLHLWRGGTLLLGSALPKVSRDRRELALAGRWEVNCWYCDDDLQLLDLDVALEGGSTLNRTIVLGIEDHVLFIADTLSSADRCNWDYSLRLPLGSEVDALGEAELREVYLRRQDKIVSLAMPLAAPEWRSISPDVGFDVAAKEWTLRYSSIGRHLHAPLFIDLRPSRSVRPRTWRSLTVAKDRVIQAVDSAVGYRVRSGNDQWLFFRALGPPAIYSVLSKHLSCEFYFGRIESDGSMTDLVQLRGA